MPTRASQVFADYVQLDPLSRFEIPDLVIQPQTFNGFAPAPPDPRVVLDGVAGSYVSTPDNAAFPVANIEVMVSVTLVNWNPTGNLDEVFVAQDDIPSNQRAFSFRRAQLGMLNFLTSSDGATVDTAVTTIRPPVTSGAAMWLRSKRNDTDGTQDFYYAPYQVGEPPVWTNIQVNRAGTAGAMFASSAPIEVGSESVGTINNLNGAVYRVLVKAAGVVVLDMNPADWHGGTSWVSATTGETWTLHGGATVADVTPVAVQRPYWGTLAVG